MLKILSGAKFVIKWGAVISAVIKAVEVLISELEGINTNSTKTPPPSA